jgi:hypothetical protein
LGVVLAGVSQLHLVGQEKVAGPANVKWEYKIDSPRASNLAEEALDNLGKDGWELIAISPQSAGGGHDRWYFKRPKTAP